MSATVAAPVAAPVSEPAMNSVVHCEDGSREDYVRADERTSSVVDSFHTRAIELIKSKHSDPKYSKLNVIQKLDYILIDLAKIAKKLYYPTYFRNRIDADKEFKDAMFVITEADMLYNGNSIYYPPRVITCQKFWSIDLLDNASISNYKSKSDIEITSEQINEAFEYYNKIINLIHQTFELCAKLNRTSI